MDIIKQTICSELWCITFLVLSITCAVTDVNPYGGSLLNDAESVLAEVRKLQTAFDPSQNISSKRLIVCRMAGGLGNRMQGIVSCVALGLALRRAVFIDWQKETRLESGFSNGLMPCGAEDLFEKTEEWNWDTESALGMHSADEQRSATVEAFRSQLVMSSGQKLDWASLLLCRNLTYLLKRTPILVVPCWRWMPEILQNAAFQPIFSRLFRGAQNGVLPFYSTVVAALFRPIAKVQAAMVAVLSYVPTGARVIGLHIRLGLSTDNAGEREHFFSPPQVTSAWVPCAYASIPHSWRDPATGARFWFLATDDQTGAALVCEALRSPAWRPGESRARFPASRARMPRLLVPSSPSLPSRARQVLLPCDAAVKGPALPPVEHRRRLRVRRGCSLASSSAAPFLHSGIIFGCRGLVERTRVGGRRRTPLTWEGPTCARTESLRGGTCHGAGVWAVHGVQCARQGRPCLSAVLAKSARGRPGPCARPQVLVSAGAWIRAAGGVPALLVRG
jgi:hypothetical protein